MKDFTTSASQSSPAPLTVGNEQPTKEPTSGRSGTTSLLSMLGTYGLPILTVLLIVLFSFLLRNTFPTQLTLDSILGTTSIVALLALAEMIISAIGQIDLSVGYGIGITHILAIGLLTRSHLPWGLVVLLVVVTGILIGLVNGLLVQVVKIDSFIARIGGLMYRVA